MSRPRSSRSGSPDREVIAAHRLHGHAMGKGRDPAVAVAQGFRPIMPKAVPAGLRTEHQGEAGIAVDVDAGQGIHLYGDAKGHKRGSRLSSDGH
jgi:hypothetical protein